VEKHKNITNAYEVARSLRQLMSPLLSEVPFYFVLGVHEGNHAVASIFLSVFAHVLIHRRRAPEV
jgi:hypothetical protein